MCTVREKVLYIGQAYVGILIYHILNVCLCVAQSCLALGDPWTVAHQAPLSMGFSRQEYWSELPFPSPGVLLDQGIKLRFPALWADSLSSEP